MARAPALPEGVVFAPDEMLLSVERWGRRGFTYWLTNRRLIVGEGRRRYRAVLVVPIEHLAAVRIEHESGCLWSADFFRVYATGGPVFQEQFTGRDGQRARALVSQLANLLAAQSS